MKFETLEIICVDKNILGVIVRYMAKNEHWFTKHEITTKMRHDAIFEVKMEGKLVRLQPTHFDNVHLSGKDEEIRLILLNLPECG